MINLESVSKLYGEVRALSRVSFAIDTGEVVGLVGPNGAGKTTTMKIVTGFLVPTDGAVTVDGNDVIADPAAAQARIGYLPENNPLYPEMPVQDYLVFVARMRGLTGANLKDRLKFAAEACGIEDMLTRPIRHLSKGYRQRVGIAQAIIHDPPILILDEPTSGLDPNQIIEIRDLIRELGRNKTVILSTHILSEVEEACSRAIIIVGGRIAADGAIDELTGGRALLVTVLSPSDPTDRLRALPGIAAVETIEAEADRWRLRLEPREGVDVAPEVFELAVNAKWKLSELAIERHSLEDVFRRVSTQGGASA